MPRKIANTAIDPTLPKTPVIIDGKTYDLCFDLGALAEAESYFQAQGHQVDLLRSLPYLDLAAVRIVFPCAAHKFHPDLSFEEAQALVRFDTMVPIAITIFDAWQASMPKPPAEQAPAASENPPEA